MLVKNVVTGGSHCFYADKELEAPVLVSQVFRFASLEEGGKLTQQVNQEEVAFIFKI